MFIFVSLNLIHLVQRFDQIIVSNVHILLQLKHKTIKGVYFFEEGPSVSSTILWAQLPSKFDRPHPCGDMDDQGIRLTYRITRLDGGAGRRVRWLEERSQEGRTEEQDVE